MPDLVATGASLLGDGDGQLPVSNVMRQFDFGQFITLYQDGPTGPVPIVVDPAGSLAAITAVRRASAVGVAADKAERAEVERLGGRSLQGLLAQDAAVPDKTVAIVVPDLRGLREKGAVDWEGENWAVSLEQDEAQALANGLTVPSDAMVAGGSRKVSLVLREEAIALDETQIAALIASGAVPAGSGAASEGLVARRDGAAISAVLGGSAVVLPLVDKDGQVRWRGRLAPRRDPAPGDLTVRDLAAFLAAPTAPDVTGADVPLMLGTEEVQTLIRDRKAVHKLANGDLNIVVREWHLLRDDGVGMAETAEDRRSDRHGGTLEQGSPVSTDPGASASTAQPVGYLSPVSGFLLQQGSTLQIMPTETARPHATGLPVALLVPWRQTWLLEGFSRGALLSSLPLTPQEEVLVEMRSWESRSRTLDQSTETDTEQTFELTASQKDTEDIFSEMTRRNDFTWQVDGSLDVSYSTGNASIDLHAGANAQNVASLGGVMRQTTNQVRDATQRSAASVRARRSTRITETVEAGSESRTTRRIRNANLTRCVTYDFFETLAHYNVTLAFQRERLQMVALIPNPERRRGPEFTSELVRQNESTFRAALIEPALSEGFAALRTLAAYDAAVALRAQRVAQAREDAARQAAMGAPATPAPAAAAPSADEQAVIDTLGGLRTAAGRLKDALVGPALDTIKADVNAVSDADRAAAQSWLFKRCLRSRMPAVMDGLLALVATSGALAIADAQALVTLLPAAGSPRQLSQIAEMTQAEKEDCGLGAEINSRLAMAWDWAWFTGRCREELLYTPNDQGVVGLCDALRKAMDDYAAKQAEGAMTAAAASAAGAANQDQSAANAQDALEMAFPLDELARARERADTLLGHVSAHPQHYSYALFQALTPAEQLARLLAASGNRLQVGMFEPRVVAMNGDDLAVPLTALASNGLQPLIDGLADGLEQVFAKVAANPETVVLPTPGVSLSSRLGPVSSAEAFVEDSRAIELDLARARLRHAMAEAGMAEAKLAQMQAVSVNPAPVLPGPA